MINSLSPHISPTGSAERSPLVDQLARKVDVNRDGEVTSAEFASFLSALMSSLDEEQGGRASAAPADGSPQPVVTPASTDHVPMTAAQATRALREAFESLPRNR